MSCVHSACEPRAFAFLTGMGKQFRDIAQAEAADAFTFREREQPRQPFQDGVGLCFVRRIRTRLRNYFDVVKHAIEDDRTAGA